MRWSKKPRSRPGSAVPDQGAAPSRLAHATPAGLNLDLPVLSAWVIDRALPGKRPGRRPSAIRTTGRWTPKATSCPTSTVSSMICHRRCPGHGAQGRHRRNRHDGPPLQHQRQQAGLRRQPGEGRLLPSSTKIPASITTMIIHLNLTHKDKPEARDLQDKNFRIGCSYAINRKEIIDMPSWSARASPTRAPRPTSPFYNEKLAKQYTEYDVAKANEYLDKVLPKKDADGMRLMPDGSRLSIVIEISNTHQGIGRRRPRWCRSTGRPSGVRYPGQGRGPRPDVHPQGRQRRRRRMAGAAKAAWIASSTRAATSPTAASRNSAQLWQYWYWVKDAARRGTAGGSQEADGTLRPAQGHRRR